MEGTAVIRYESESGWWETASRPAHPRLRGLVTRYTGYRERTVTPRRLPQLPSAEVTLILGFGEPVRVLPGASSPVRPGTATSFVAGLHLGPAVTEHTGRQHHVGVTLTPLGAHALCTTPMHELTNRIVDLDELLGTGAEELVCRLHGTPDWPSRFALLDDLLTARMAAGPAPAPVVVLALERLHQTSGRLSVGQLVDEVGCSHRHLVARFREQIGLTPKALARLLRFQASLRLHERGCLSLAEVATTAGYYDQAHLHREFRDLAGCTPTALLAARDGR